MSLATLGPITFEVTDQKVLTWADARRSGSARWSEHEVYSGKPKSEFLGPGNDKITMSVRLDASRGVGPADELKRMREARDTGAVLQFQIGGSLVGDFKLESLEEQWRVFARGGGLSLAQVSLSLGEYA